MNAVRTQIVRTIFGRFQFPARLGNVFKLQRHAANGWKTAGQGGDACGREAAHPVEEPMPEAPTELKMPDETIF